MEVHINNNYLESFVSRYAKENASKVVKYLAIFGIHFLSSINKQNSQLSEMKALAKSIIKSRPNEGKHINHELRVLKDELEKLSKRVANNIGTIVPQQQEMSDRLHSSKKQQEDLQQYSLNKSPSLPTKFDTKTLTQKPPTATAWREVGEKKLSDRRGHRLDNIEEINEPIYESKESRTRISPSNRERSITPKPNEITHSRIEPRDSKNSFTRHHLDDSGAKEAFKEENVVYFPRKQKEERYNSGKKETSKDPSQGKSPFFGNRRPQIEEHGHPQWSDSRDYVSNLTVQSTKSPHFPTMKDDFLCRTPVAGTAQKEKENSRPLMSSTTHKGDTRGPKSSVRSSHKLESTHKNKKPVAHDKTKKDVKPNKHCHLRASQPMSTSTPNYKNVESKIKDEVNYHKELAKQYKKMKQSLGQSTGFDEDPMLRGSSRLEPSRDKVVHVGDKESMRTTGGYEENQRYRASKALESGTSTAQRSSLTMQQTMNPMEKTSSHSHHHKSRNDQENLGKNEGHHRDSTGRGGILDIANSFLNSPLMQHISNIDNSLKEPASGQRTPADMKSSNGFGRSINGVSDIEDDVRLQSSNGFQQSRYSNWGNGNYQPDKSVRSTGSILKDSTNRKYGEKDLRSSCNKDGASSLASSNFSNFLNEDMKGFYQKESLDQKKPKNSAMMVRFGSSENSSNVSFSGNEGPNDKKPNLNVNPKAQDGFSFDQNVFKNERMTMTQL